MDEKDLDISSLKIIKLIELLDIYQYSIEVKLWSLNETDETDYSKNLSFYTTKSY